MVLQKDILWFQIAMHNFEIPLKFERLKDLNRKPPY